MTRISNHCPYLQLGDNSGKSRWVFPSELLFLISPPRAWGGERSGGAARAVGATAKGSRARLNSILPGRPGLFLHLFVHLFLCQWCLSWIETWNLSEGSPQRPPPAAIAERFLVRKELAHR